MLSAITAEKAALRRAVRAQLAARSPEEKRQSDLALAAQFLALPQVQAAESLLLFWGVGTEPNTVPILDALWSAGKQILLPRCLPDRGMEARLVRSPAALSPGMFHIPEPGEDCLRVERDNIDLILAPAICYDQSGFRLGQGGGYYDRYLNGYGGLTVGLCPALVLAERVPCEAHDRPVTFVLTERSCLSTWTDSIGGTPKGPAAAGRNTEKAK